MTDAPAGWYPDPENPTAQRWWDGTQWAAATPADPYRMETAAALRSPEGVSTNTVWIWLIILLPLLPMLALLTIDWRGFMIATLQAPENPFAGYTAFGPSYLIATFGGWVAYGLVVFFSFRDVKTLEARGIPRPFHWAWSFLSSIVYIIGRGVVTRRRGGPGLGMIWAGVGVIVAYIVLVIVMMVVMITQMMSVLPYLPTR